MAFRFQRRIRIAPGVRINLSKSGVGLSVGPRGYSTSIGPRGAYRNVGLPGTGLSYREKIGSRSRSNSSGQASATATEVEVEVDTDGKMRFTLPDGAPAPQSLVKRVRDQNSQLIENIITRAVEQFNQDLRACLSIHLGTPSPAYRPLAVLTAPPEEPQKPTPRDPGFWDKLFLRAHRIEAENNLVLKNYEKACEEWISELQDYDTLVAELSELNSLVQAGHIDAQARVFESRLEEVVWAKPTDISFDFGEDAATVSIDVDLPTVSQLPDREAMAPTRGVNIRWKQRSDAQMRRDFCYLAHATLFRVAGEAFAALPQVRQVTVSGFTQRLDQALGRTGDVYVLSVRIERSDWKQIDFHRLSAVDVQASLGSFQLLRDMSRGSELREITPFD